MSIKIIGAGFPRTGTTTLKGSLESLGFKHVYHMKELLVNPNMLHYWQTLAETGDTDWESLYQGYDATVDFPGYPWYKEHMKKYPDAKVILTVRDFEAWYKSVDSTVFRAGPQTPAEKIKMMGKLLFSARARKVVKCIKFFKKIFFANKLQGKFEEKEFARKTWEDHIANVKATVPKDKLLVYDVRDGWGPLCRFLGVPEPAEPLPHLNKKENFKEMLPQLMKGKMV
ncbi:sulfotransferase family protein [Cyclobacterium plantarum]|uniref:Sulfotransferase family protein n=1 Tax=Cyclobacterium plantarum TaxID=2716263 RepID=A0ABX0H3A0_9BACT|nr:sulfotransferase family protein [Cyclobacterium plantarum]NHE56286.1 sulfotransferase family protein [Cyclobacterium plantarum]